MADRDYVIDFSRVKRTWLDAVDGVKDVRQLNHQNKVKGWQRQIENCETTPEGRRSWEGATAHETKGWLKTGYKAKEVPKVKFARPTEGAPKVVWGEDGDELDLGKMWSGDPTPFSTRENPPAKPGLRIVVDYSLSCGTDPEILTEFGSYVAALTDAFSQNGYDLDVDARITVSCLYTTSSWSDKTHINIRLKKLGVKTDFAAWSPMFSPAGFRQLGFTAMYLSGDDINETCQSNLGYPCADENKWGARWDDKTRTLYLDSPNTATSFDADAITKGVRATGLLA